MSTMTRRYHPAQRFTVTFPEHRTVEFVGSTERYDVFWIGDSKKVMIKYTNQAGSGFFSYPARPMEFARSTEMFSNKTMMPTDEEKELIWTMTKTFARHNRPAEWDVKEE